MISAKKILLLLFCIVVLSSFASASSIFADSLNDGLAVLHEFDNSTTIGALSIDSLLRYNATINGADYGYAGLLKHGEAYNYVLANSDRLTFPDMSGALSTAVGTVSVWTKPDVVGGNDDVFAF